MTLTPRFECCRKTGTRIADSVLDLIGMTPLLKFHRLPRPGSAEILGKLEYFSPGGSVKDRIALTMIRKGEELGLIGPETVIIEPSSGNTGIGLAMAAAARGYRCIIVLPENMSMERVFILKRFGAEVILTPAHLGMTGAVEKVREIAEKEQNVFLPHQFENIWNVETHRETTALEILDATEGRIDALVAGVGTGGTITGIGEILKERVPGIRIVAVEPAASPVLSGGQAGHHKIQGIGAGFVPAILNRAVIDEIRTVDDETAYRTMARIAAEEGVLAGISAGAAVHAAIEVAAEIGAGGRVVVILADTGERYFSAQHYFEF